LDDLRVGTPPLALGREALNPLDEHTPVPRAVENRHPTPARQSTREAVQEVMPTVVVAGRSELGDANVPWIEWAG
jgi:hypothetical protein